LCGRQAGEEREGEDCDLGIHVSDKFREDSSRETERRRNEGEFGQQDFTTEGTETTEGAGEKGAVNLNTKGAKEAKEMRERDCGRGRG
jgi:hypothetical protein